MATSKKELKFTQPTKGVHSYDSINDETSGSLSGYNVFGDRETKQWTVKYNGQPVGESYASRPEAVKAANAHAYPDQAAEAESSGVEKPVVKLNNREHAILTAIKGVAPKAAGILDIADLTKFSAEIVMSGVSALGRRGYIKLSGLESTITEQGEQAYAEFVPSNRIDGSRRADPITEEARLAQREARVRSKPGFNEEEHGYLLQPITELELERLKLAVAEANIEHTKGVQRAYPLSKGVDARLTNNLAARDEILHNISELEAGRPRPKRDRSAAEAEAPAAEAEAPAESE